MIDWVYMLKFRVGGIILLRRRICRFLNESGLSQFKNDAIRKKISENPSTLRGRFEWIPFVEDKDNSEDLSPDLDRTYFCQVLHGSPEMTNLCSILNLWLSDSTVTVILSPSSWNAFMVKYAMTFARIPPWAPMIKITCKIRIYNNSFSFKLMKGFSSS